MPTLRGRMVPLDETQTKKWSQAVPLLSWLLLRGEQRGTDKTEGQGERTMIRERPDIDIDTVFDTKNKIVIINTYKKPEKTKIIFDEESQSILVSIVEKCPRCRKTITKRYVRNVFDLIYTKKEIEQWT